MAYTLRNQAIVASDHSITVHAPELKPGALVDVIVLVNSDLGPTTTKAASFIDAVADVKVDAPADYSVNFEETVYRALRHA